MAKLQNITAFEILDSTGNPALSVTVHLDDGTSEIASTANNHFPASFGVIDIKDNDPKRFQGNGLLQAIQIIESIIKPRLIGLEANNQQGIDGILLSLDTSVNKNKIGGNTMTAISMAIAKAAAKSKNEPLFIYLQKMIAAEGIRLPVPIFTLIDGGKNANYNTEIDEFVILPATNKTLFQSIELGALSHKLLAQTLMKENILPFTGEKGGLAPLLSTNEDALSLINQAFDSVNIRLGYDAYLGLNANANTFYKDEHYKLKDHNIPMKRGELIKFYAELCKKYHVLYIEDPMADEDIDGWAELFNSLSSSTIIAGDYYTSTNPARLQMALTKKTINGIVLKPSSVGTITETLAVAVMARTAGLKIIISDNTATTNDTFLTDLSVAISADYVRFGAPVRGERTVKYNRLLEIEKLLNTNSIGGKE